MLMQILLKNTVIADRLQPAMQEHLMLAVAKLELSASYSLLLE
jgi:hypothetical protein